VLGGLDGVVAGDLGPAVERDAAVLGVDRHDDVARVLQAS
jgi:hypothetical protein